MVFSGHTDPGNQGDMARILRGCISTAECSPDKRETNVRLIPSLLFLWARNSAGECSPCKREAAGSIPVGSTFWSSGGNGRHACFKTRCESCYRLEVQIFSRPLLPLSISW